MQDVIIKCRDCGNEFTVTASEQKWFELKQLALPKRCKHCRSKRKNNK